MKPIRRWIPTFWVGIHLLIGLVCGTVSTYFANQGEAEKERGP
jgi:hypothetical protein